VVQTSNALGTVGKQRDRDDNDKGEEHAETPPPEHIHEKIDRYYRDYLGSMNLEVA
jgi:hypothetical protein